MQTGQPHTGSILILAPLACIQVAVVNNRRYLHISCAFKQEYTILSCQIYNSDNIGSPNLADGRLSGFPITNHVSGLGDW